MMINKSERNRDYKLLQKFWDCIKSNIFGMNFEEAYERYVAKLPKKEVLFSSNKTDWETPDLFYENLNKNFKFGFDLAASDSNAKCKNYFTEEDDALSKDWSKEAAPIGDFNWLNPPYNLVKQFLKKCSEETRNGVRIVALVPARTDTIWFHDYVEGIAGMVALIKGRLKFGINGIPHGTAPFPSCLIVYPGVPVSKTEYVKLDKNGTLFY